MVFINSLQELSKLRRLPSFWFQNLTVLSSDDLSIDKFRHVATMYFVEGIIVDVLHTVIDDGSSKDVTNVC